MKDHETMNSQELATAITQAQQDAAMYERLKGAAKLLTVLQAEQTARAQAATDSAEAFHEAEIARWTIESVFKTHSEHEGLLSAHTVACIDKRTGERVKFSLAKAPRPVAAAVARDPKKIPVGILKLGDTPEAALGRWILSANRGYVAG